MNIRRRLMRKFCRVRDVRIAEYLRPLSSEVGSSVGKLDRTNSSKKRSIGGNQIGGRVRAFSLIRSNRVVSARSTSFISPSLLPFHFLPLRSSFQTAPTPLTTRFHPASIPLLPRFFSAPSPLKN